MLYFFFFNDTATTEIYTLSLHDALPISAWVARPARVRAASCASAGGASRTARRSRATREEGARVPRSDRKSTRLNSSHANISYAVFCLKKKTAQHPVHGLHRVHSRSSNN